MDTNENKAVKANKENKNEKGGIVLSVLGCIWKYKTMLL
jgi:hypothetical protein